MQASTPLWTSHDRVNANPGAPLTSHAFVKNFKKYAKEAGIGDVHLHQTRHTVARIVAERDGIKAAQEQLGHKNETTTRVYVQRVGVRRDRFSEHLADEFGIEA
jgi:integrase